MYSKLNQLGLLLLATFALSACTQETIEIPRSEEYAREFIKQFGIVDPNHDWTAAQHVSVTVKTATPTDIRILADFAGKTYRFGNFKKVNGTQTLSFDLPLGATNLKIRSKNKAIAVPPGATVDFANASRYIIGDNTEEDGGIDENGMIVRHTGSRTLTAGATKDYKIFHQQAIRDFLKLVPEEKQNFTKVTSNFYFTSVENQVVTLYPLFWYTGSSHILGIFWLDDNEKFNWWDSENQKPTFVQMQDLYWTRSGELTYCTDEYPISEDKPFDRDEFNAYYADRTFQPIPKQQRSVDEGKDYALKTRGISIKFNKSGVRFGFYIKVGNNNFNQLYGTGYPKDENGNLVKTYTAEDGTISNTYEHIVFSNSTRNRDYGAFWQDVVGTDWGNYTVNYYPADQKDEIPTLEELQAQGLQRLDGPNAPSNHHDYSQFPSPEFNNNIHAPGFDWEIPSDIIDPELIEKYKYTQASYKHVAAEDMFDGVERYFFAFEDYKLKGPDLNDLLFVLESSGVDVTDETTGETEEIGDTDPEPVFPWVIACEDLGGTYDHDFNDIVFGVQHEAGSKYAYVTALAAGGTLPIRIYYNGTEIKGGTNPDDETMGAQYTMYSPTDTKEFTEWHQWFGKSYTQVTNANGFTVGATVRIVVDENFTMSGDPNNPNITIGDNNRLGGFHVEVDQTDGTTTTIVAPVKGSDPGNHIPQMFVTTHKFEWPTERTPIYQTHRGDINGTHIGDDTPSNSAGTTQKYSYYTNSFHAWVNNAADHAGFHSQPATEQGKVVHHNWSGYAITTP